MRFPLYFIKRDKLLPKKLKLQLKSFRKPDPNSFVTIDSHSVLIDTKGVCLGEYSLVLVSSLALMTDSITITIHEKDTGYNGFPDSSTAWRPCLLFTWSTSSLSSSYFFTASLHLQGKFSEQILQILKKVGKEFPMPTSRVLRQN